MMNSKVCSKAGVMILAGLSVLASPSAFAQSGGAESVVQGRLDSKSPKYEDKAYAVTTVTLEGGKRYAFDAVSEAFDTGLRISFADDNDQIFAEDDDGGDGTNANIEFIAPTNGRYRIRVSSVNGDTGAYTLKQKTLPPLPALLKPTPTATSTMQIKSFQGTLSKSDGFVRGRYVDDYVFNFEAGKMVYLGLNQANGASDDGFDPLLEVYEGTSRNQTSALVSDDDSGEGMNSVINFVPEKTGAYIVRVTSTNELQGNQGYTLRFGQHP